MQCTVEEIAEKRRIAQEKLKARQNRAITNENTSLSTASTTRTAKTMPAEASRSIAEEIAEKRRIAQEKLKARQNQSITSGNLPPSTSSTPQIDKTITPASATHSAQDRLMEHGSLAVSAAKSPATGKQISTIPASIFYGSSTEAITANISNYEAKIKGKTPKKHINRILSQPYPAKDAKVVATAHKENTDGNKMAMQYGSSITKIVTCACSMVSSTYFQVVTSGYNEKLISVFKSIPSRKYNTETKIWSFSLTEYDVVQEKVSNLKPDIVIGTIPKFVLGVLRNPLPEPSNQCLLAIESTIAKELLPFQEEGVCFAIQKQGRCIIADEMGLGKTYQAIAIADFYKDDWPLLVCTTASTLDAWAEKIGTLLPWIPKQHINRLISTQDYVSDARVIIVSYNLMERNIDLLLERKFGVVIFDESHSLKNFKGKRTNAAERLSQQAKRMLLLTGTPALSRPVELFSQLQMIDRKFFSFMEFSKRYCDGKAGNFGWDSSGQSNLQELTVVLYSKFMIRRTKEEVQYQLKEKSRQNVFLDPKYVWNSNNMSTLENMKSYSEDIQKSTGRSREGLLLKFYAETAHIKSGAVCKYLKEMLRTDRKNKFIIFAHHQVMLNAITACVKELNVNFIRIDGSTSNSHRTAYVDKFQTDKLCRAAVLSLKACNAGITLTAANLVIFAELDWNPSTLAQAEARAHRIGQSREVKCIYLLATGTADDYIWGLLKRKQDTLSMVGLFNDDLSNGTCSTVTPNKNSITNYFESAENIADQPQAGTSADQNESVQCQSISNSDKSNICDLLNDGNDTDFLELDY